MVFYDQAEFTVSSTDVTLGTLATLGSTANGKGYSPTATNGWAIQVNATMPGELNIGLSTTTGIITTSASGTLAIINFHIKSTAIAEVTKIDLAANTFNGPPSTDIADQNFHNYALNPAPLNNVAAPLSPYTYTRHGTPTTWRGYDHRCQSSSRGQ